MILKWRWFKNVVKNLHFLTILAVTNIDIYNFEYTNKSANSTGHSSVLNSARHPMNARHFVNRKH